MTELSVLIPTVGTRPEMLRQVIDAVYDTVPDVEVLLETGVSWGEGLNRMVARASGRYLSCCCDDTVPLPGWFEAGRAMLDQGVMPASRYLHPDSEPLRRGWDDAPHGTRVDWCRSFLLTPGLYFKVGAFIDATWYADIDYSERLVKAGWPIHACDGFAFTHLGGIRDWHTPERDLYEQEQYVTSHRRQGLL